MRSKLAQNPRRLLWCVGKYTHNTPSKVAHPFTLLLARIHVTRVKYHSSGGSTDIGARGLARYIYGQNEREDTWEAFGGDMAILPCSEREKKRKRNSSRTRDRFGGRECVCALVACLTGRVVYWIGLGLLCHPLCGK